MSNLWNRIAKLYDPIMCVGHLFYDKMLVEMVKDLGPDDKVAELAAGTGTVTVSIAGSVASLSASDLSPKMIEVAEKKAESAGLSNIDFSVQDACDLDYPDGVFDVVVIVAALHIIPDPEKVMAEITRILKAGGKLIAPTFIGGTHRRSRFVTGVMRISGYRDYGKWTPARYTKFLKDHGFRVQKEITYQKLIPMEYVVATKEADHE